MKLSEAIRVADKAKSWLDRLPEQVAAINELQDAARSLLGEKSPRDRSVFDRIATEIKSEFTDLAEGIVGLNLPDEPERSEPPAEDPDKVAARAEVLRLLERTAFTEGYEQSYRAHVGGPPDDRLTAKAEAAARAQYPDPKPVPPVPPKPGDTVPDRDAAKRLPHGTLIKDQAGMRGLVSGSGSGANTVVRWTEPAPSPVWPATVVDVAVP